MKSKLLYFCMSFLFIIVFSRSDIFAMIRIQKLIPASKIDYISTGLMIKQAPSDMAFDKDKNLFILNYFKHCVYKININGKIIKKFGRKGVGPGDLYLPYKISIYGKKIFILDNNAISIFDINGNFIKRFRIFNALDNIKANDKFIFASNSRSGEKISIFDYKGNKVKEIGNCSKLLNFKKYEGKPVILFTTLTKADIAIDSKHIYLLYLMLGEIYKYDFKGNLIQKKIINFSDKYFDKIQWKIRSVILNGKYKGHINSAGSFVVDANNIITGIKYYQGKLYLSVSDLYQNENKKGVLFIVDPNTLAVKKELLYYDVKASKRYIQNIFSCNLSIIKIRGVLYYYIPILNDEGDNYIGVYKEVK